MLQKRFDPPNTYQNTARFMNPEQFDAIVKAIIEGKYSWACVLILRFAGYNPAHYIPYRTYKRLIKENRRNQTTPQSVQESASDLENTIMQTERCSPQTQQNSVLAKTK